MFAAVVVSTLVILQLLTATRATLQRRSDNEVAIYWGFGQERNLAAYCTPGQGINILIIGSITKLKSGGSLTGIFGSECTVDTDGSFTSGCAKVGQDIETCQAAGIKVFVGFSSYQDKWAIKGTAGASEIASELWRYYGGDFSAIKKRPFGYVKVDGFDFDVENNPNGQSKAYLGDLVDGVRDYFLEDVTKTYYISGAPECAIPDPNMGPAMMQAQFDYLWIQFYNNDCAAADLVKNPKNNPNGKASYNIGKWPAYLAKGASASASLFVGLPASKSAAVPYDFIKAADLPKVIEASPGIGGVMLWNTHHSDATFHHNCTYAQNVANVFSSGEPC